MSRTSEAIKHLKDLQHINLEGLRFRFIDAKGQIVGRLAQQIAIMLQGKDKPTYNPKKESGDVVIVVNASHVHFTHDKWRTQLYRWHTGYPGGLRTRTAQEQWEKDPRDILRNAVNGMLPKNKSREARLEKLKIFPEADHPFEGFPLVPHVPPPRKLRDLGLGWPVPQGFEPANPDRYAFRILTSPSLQPQRPASPPPTHPQQQQQQQGLPATAGTVSEAASTTAAAGAAAASPAGPRFRPRPRPVVSIDDLLTEEERRALAALEQRGQGQAGQG